MHLLPHLSTAAHLRHRLIGGAHAAARHALKVPEVRLEACKSLASNLPQRTVDILTDGSGRSDASEWQACSLTSGTFRLSSMSRSSACPTNRCSNQMGTRRAVQPCDRRTSAEEEWSVNFARALSAQVEAADLLHWLVGHALLPDIQPAPAAANTTAPPSTTLEAYTRINMP